MAATQRNAGSVHAPAPIQEEVMSDTTAAAWILRLPAPNPTAELMAETGGDGFGRLNHATTFKTKDEADRYADGCAYRHSMVDGKAARVPAPECRPAVVPLYTAAAIAALAGQADAGRWIPCSERLPEVGQPVAVMDAVRRENCGGDLIRQVQDCAYLDDYGSGPFWNRRGSRGECLDAYTHWTALPPESLIAGATP